MILGLMFAETGCRSWIVSDFKRDHDSTPGTPGAVHMYSTVYATRIIVQ